MYTVIISMNGKVSTGRKFQDHGAGKAQTRMAALQEFNDEIYAALKTSHLMACDFELELLDTSTGKVISRYFTKAAEPVIDRTEPKELA